MFDDEGNAQLINEQIYSENLTDALTDADAKILLEWGETQMREGIPNQPDSEAIDELGWQTRRVIQTMNSIIEKRDRFSDASMARRLIRLVERAMALEAQKSPQPVQNDTDSVKPITQALSKEDINPYDQEKE